MFGCCTGCFASQAQLRSRTFALAEGDFQAVADQVSGLWVRMEGAAMSPSGTRIATGLPYQCPQARPTDRQALSLDTDTPLSSGGATGETQGRAWVRG